MVSQKTERTIAGALGILVIIVTISGVVHTFSNLSARLEQLEQRVATLTPMRGSRGAICEQITTTHLQAIMAGDGEKATALSAELDRFDCTGFEAMTVPIEEAEQVDRLLPPPDPSPSPVTTPPQSPSP